MAGTPAQHWEAPGSTTLLSLKAFKPIVFCVIYILKQPGLEVAQAELGSDRKAAWEQEQREPEGFCGWVEESLGCHHAEERGLRRGLPLCGQILSSH